MARKSERERREAQRDAHQRVWADFYPRLRATKSLEEAVALYGQTPPPSSPGRPFFSNLGFFLANLVVPNGATPAEAHEYARLAGLFHAAGLISEETKVRIEAAADRQTEF